MKKQAAPCSKSRTLPVMILVAANRIPTGYIAIAQANYMRIRNIQTVVIDVVSEEI